MSKILRRQEAEARRVLREVTARWSAVRALVAWAQLSSRERALVTGELEILQSMGQGGAVGVALDALEAIPAVVETHALTRGVLDMERIAGLARSLIERRSPF